MQLIYSFSVPEALMLISGKSITLMRKKGIKAFNGY
jgi:hypothetical protein